VIRLSVNVNKIAVLRNSRGGSEPDIGKAATACLRAGAHGITVHPRPDQRHIRPDDVHAIKALLPPQAEFNIEGNGFAPARGAYPGLLALVAAARPTQVTLVPDGDEQLTSDHGFDLAADADRLRPLLAQLKQYASRVSLFIDAGVRDVERAAEAGADRVEIYTGPFAQAFAAGDAGRELELCTRVAERARASGLGVNAGHDLNLANLGALKLAVPFLAEVSIGHALVGEALYHGLEATVKDYLRILNA
jgi:pyridoxine 5-phosphate synthase